LFFFCIFFIEKLLQYFKQQKRLTSEQVHRILHRARAYFEGIPNVLDITIEPGKELTVLVCLLLLLLLLFFIIIFLIQGDTHGQYFDLLHVFEKNGVPSSENPYIFNGDYVDRGSFGTEVYFYYLIKKIKKNIIFPSSFFFFKIMILLICFKLAFPDHVHLLRVLFFYFLNIILIYFYIIIIIITIRVIMNQNNVHRNMDLKQKFFFFFHKIYFIFIILLFYYLLIIFLLFISVKINMMMMYINTSFIFSTHYLCVQ
jgi:hypothetical protein